MKSTLLTLVVLLFLSCSEPVFAYTDEELAMAIYQAEGGVAAQYPFGIRSVYCGTWTECKRICKTTIKHNRIRFAHVGHKRFATYLEYLAQRYCPCTGRSLSQAERKLNKNWIKNVKYYLMKGDIRGGNS